MAESSIEEVFRVQEFGGIQKSREANRIENTGILGY